MGSSPTTSVDPPRCGDDRALNVRTGPTFLRFQTADHSTAGRGGTPFVLHGIAAAAPTTSTAAKSNKFKIGRRVEDGGVAITVNAVKAVRDITVTQETYNNRHETRAARAYRQLGRAPAVLRWGVSFAARISLEQPPSHPRLRRRGASV